MKFVLTIPDHETERNRHFDDLDQAYDYADRVLTRLPETIIMMSVVRTSICKNCRVPIQELPGAIIHKWVHQGSITRVCFNKELTQAEPREEV